MFARKSKNTIDSLIGASTVIEGDVQFQGGLRIDGHIKGNVSATGEGVSILVISEQAKIDGEVRAAHIIVSGVINGPVFASEIIDLQPKARIHGDLRYKTMEMHSGAVVSGNLTHDVNAEPVLKLASKNSSAA